jgi:hypothetical protein
LVFGIAIKPFNMKCVGFLVVGGSGVFKPMALVHAGIGTIIYLAKVFHADKNRIAAKTEMVPHIANQLFAVADGILLPLALQCYYTLALERRIETTAEEAGSKKQEAGSFD